MARSAFARRSSLGVTWLAAAVSSFASARGEGIYVMQVDGTAVRKVVEVAGCKAHGSPQWSHDGRRLAFDAAPVNKGASRWYIVNVDGTGLREMGDHAMPHWSPDDKQLVYQNYGFANVKMGAWVRNFDGQGKSCLVEGLAPRWSPDGGRIAFSDGRQIRSLDLVDEKTQPLHGNAFEHIEIGFDWSRDGQRLAFVGERGNRPGIVNANQREKGRDLVISSTAGDEVRYTHRGLQGHVAWSPDDKTICLAIDDRLCLIAVDGDQAPEPIAGQVDKNTDPAWSPDGQWLAFASSRQTPEPAPVVAARPRWKLVETARHPKGSIVYGLGFTPDGGWVVMGGDPIDQGVQVWSLATGETQQLGGLGIAISMFPDGKQFATSWLSQKVQIVSVDSGDVVRELDHGATVRALALSKDGTRLVTGGLDHRLKVWKTSTGELISSFHKHDSWLTRAVFTADGKSVYSAGHDNKVHLWDASNGNETPREMDHPETVWGIAVSPDGRFVLTGTGGSFIGSPINLYISQGNDNTIRMWDTAAGKQLAEMKGHTNTVYTLDISPDGRLAVSGSWDGTIRLWDLESRTEISRIEGGQGYVTRVLFSPDGTQVIAGGGVTRQPGVIVTYPNEQIRLYQVVEFNAAEK